MRCFGAVVPHAVDVIDVPVFPVFRAVVPDHMRNAVFMKISQHRFRGVVGNKKELLVSQV